MTSPLRSLLRPASRVLATAGLVLVASGCTGLGKYTWVDEYQEKPPPLDASYRIAAGDLLNIRVWNQESLTTQARVRDDGRISLLFLDDVEAAGHSPAMLSQQIQTRLKDYINHPVVTVALEMPRPIKVTMVGEVNRIGPLEIDVGASLLQALAGAGGFTEYAHKDRIFVMRQDDGQAPVRIRFRYQDLIHAEGRAPSFRLRPGDVVVVE
ncbi:polysaccharide export protein [Myxococcus sp. MISCRS1]|jgi:polysaccharide export outer membrane protein|uniref:exopolysaccharide export protein EpsY n=1 Tax=Myxococcus TaxID=32 RepID=UPI001CC0ADEC|nr:MULTISPECIES: exopolysaccharide export protein EpsY [Myxococcus]BDT38727.1 polysaccharide export protein [Myxococcus sp. MH1]MBZ4399076.1 polysaccharide export protein [Myxococcus sp. AS-1-15]MBZ4413327.1 polysaccharide export protein [Myxococcus sp. XM-1-1-1]MCK8499733.1 polysaccharide export protein [Myxococcus fulvus]MCY0999571.1 polysaccharide export protein [Myxococcus sp. MISCRS1]